MKEINSFIGQNNDWLQTEWEHDGQIYFTLIPPKIVRDVDTPVTVYDRDAAEKMAKSFVSQSNLCNDGTKATECAGCPESDLCE